jgi:hypothetical protein
MLAAVTPGRRVANEIGPAALRRGRSVYCWLFSTGGRRLQHGHEHVGRRQLVLGLNTLDHPRRQLDQQQHGQRPVIVFGPGQFGIEPLDRFVIERFDRRRLDQQRLDQQRFTQQRHDKQRHDEQRLIFGGRFLQRRWRPRRLLVRRRRRLRLGDLH